MLGGGLSCNFPGDGAGGVFGPTGPSCPVHQGNEAGEARAEPQGEDTLVACVRAERLRQRTECREPGGYGIVHLVKNREAPFKCGLAERTPGGSLLERAPGPLRAQQPCGLRGGGAHISGHRAAAGGGQSAAAGEGLSSEFPSPKLSRQPGPLLHSGSRRWPSVPANSPLLTARPPVQESSQESVGRQPQGPRPLCTPALWPAPVYSVPVYVGLTV